MDPDEAFNNSSNFTEETYTNRPDFYERLFLELFTVVGLISVATNVLIVFVIVKYKKLQDVTNIIIAHLSVLQATYLFVTPLSVRVFSLLEDVGPVHLSVFCVFYELEYIMVFIICLFILLLICDWYLKLYYEQKYLKFCRAYKCLVGAAYICGISLIAVTMQFCLKAERFYTIAAFLSFLAYLFLVLFLFVMNVIHLIRRRNLQRQSNSVGLFIANTFVGLWLPVIGMLVLHIFAVHCDLALILFTALAFSSPVFNFIYLFYYDNNFNVFLKTVFRCQCNDYKNDTLDDQPVLYSDANGVQINQS